MLLQTNSYIVPREKRVEHARLLRRFRQALMRLGCDHFEVFEQVGANWNGADTTGRFVQIMRFRDRKHQLAVQAAERNDPTSQALLQEFCDLINFQYQQQQGLFAVGYYTSFLRMPSKPPVAAPEPTPAGEAQETESPGAPPDADGQPEQERAAGPSLVIPQPEPGAEPEPAADFSGEDVEEEPGDIDFNSESPPPLPEDSPEPTGHDAFSSLPDDNLPETGDSNEISDVVPHEAASNGDAEAENPTTPSNS